MDLADRGRGRPRRARLGDRLVQLHRPAQPHAARASRPAGVRLRDAAPRQDARPDLPDRLQGRPALRRHRHSIPTTRRDWSPRFGNDNLFWRLHAQRLLVERGKTDVVPALIERVADRSVDAIGLNVGAIHALWTLHGLGAWTARPSRRRPMAVVAALEHPSAGVRRNAVAGAAARCVVRRAADLKAGLLSDPDGQVRLAALLALADQPPSEEVAAALAAALRKGLARNDHWLFDAATAAAARNDRAFLKAIVARGDGGSRPGRRCVAITERVAEHWARGGPIDGVGPVLAGLKGGEPAVDEAVLRGMAKGWPKDRPARIDRGGRGRAEGPGQGAADPPHEPNWCDWWASGATRPWTASPPRSATSLTATARDESLADARADRRRAAARRAARPTDEAVAKELLGLIVPRTSPDLAAGLIEAVTSSQAPQVGKDLVEILPKLGAERPRPGAQSPARAIGLDPRPCGGVRAEPGRDLRAGAGPEAGSRRTPESRHRRAGQGACWRKAAAFPIRTARRSSTSSPLRSSEGGDVAQGKVVFQQQCAKCHRHGSEGGQVGPDLTGTAALPRDELLIHILDPSRWSRGTTSSTPSRRPRAA